MTLRRESTGGLVLAGGRSVRFGAEKAAATLKGRPLLRLALDRLEGVCARLAVSAPRDSLAARMAADWGVAVLADPPGTPRGPLAGLSVGLAWARSRGLDRLAVMPCDLPSAPHDLFERLEEAMGEASAASALSPDGPQPLCLMADVTLHDGLAAILSGGRHPPVHEWLAAVGARQIFFDDAAAFANVNTPQDLARLEASEGAPCQRGPAG